MAADKITSGDDVIPVDIGIPVRTASGRDGYITLTGQQLIDMQMNEIARRLNILATTLPAGHSLYPLGRALSPEAREVVAALAAGGKWG